MRRVNVSLDTLDRGRFEITRWGNRQGDGGDLGSQGCPSFRQDQCIALKGFSEDELDRMIGWCGAENV
ncbi:MAG: hypothetical protein R3D03_08185 [Geminicoccaceae bacterium]